ncbi:spermidine resistance protein [Lobosporangium transversale]|uniref:S-adenosylmethionine decarboxylase n=1 Tax=Lobosporangium transversale TaxID=64571 RepID=A0A1Y2GVE9_9FUNG|nr:S-adenosylmethionine decarboxylase [Lobosporangium transversale]KAF9916502.1 spermidine resistance protein [Lobosporangium transversale]ORZ26286.1 S-adenosylmethionine decarboxylase [Lobosporangium transversale]|eukprot:XP_021884051.1 S-adenosylmethionine decarboxylase [Lobosporangium transversale]
MTVPVPVPSSAQAAVTGELKSVALQHLHQSINLTTPFTTTATTTTHHDSAAPMNSDAPAAHVHLHDNEAGFKNDAFLDTTNDTQEAGSFEGPEKLLEIWFSPAPFPLQGIRTIPTALQPADNDETFGGSDRYGLRIVPKPIWDEMLAIVKCQVLNSIQNDCMDAFLLSESSFFVYPHKLILKTCGTTTLLMALPKILEIAQNYCGLEKVWRVFYSRKTFMFPERQLHVHRDWKDEVAFLDRHFEHGAAYTVGKVNGDHWCLYLTAPQDDCLSHITSRRNSTNSLEDVNVVNNENNDVMVTDEQGEGKVSLPLSIVTDGTTTAGVAGEDSPLVSPGSPSSSSSVSSSSSSISFASSASSVSYLYPSHDQTVEILMTNLNPEAMKRFYQRPDDVPGTVGGVRVDQETGLAGLFPQAQLDSYLFTPCGYSANAMQDGNYYTIHVTPEPVCSYASFETNIPVGLGSRKRIRGSSASGDSTPKSATSGSENGDDKEDDVVSKATYTGPETLTELISRVVEIFQPGTMSVTLFSSHLTEDGQMETERQMERRQRRMVKAMGRIAGFTRTDRILYEFDGCDLVFGHFVAKA